MIDDDRYYEDAVPDPKAGGKDPKAGEKPSTDTKPTTDPKAGEKPETEAEKTLRE